MWAANGFKLPIFVAITCMVGAFHMDDDWTDERWLRAGTPTVPKGAVGFFATSSCVVGGGSSHTPRRNAMDEGIFKGIFEDSLLTFGATTMRGRMYVLEQYPTPEEWAQYAYEAHNIIGEPELNLWTATPESVDVTTPALLTTGQSQFTVTVSRERGREPIEGALVCVMMDTLVYEWSYTDGSGQAEFDVSCRKKGTWDTR